MSRTRAQKRTTTYADRLDRRRKDLGVSIRELARQVERRLPGVRGATYTGVRLYLSRGSEPQNPKPEILRAMAEALGTSLAWVVGETDDPSERGEADVRRQLWAHLGREDDRRREAIERSLPDYRRLSLAAKEAVRELMAHLPLHRDLGVVVTHFTKSGERRRVRVVGEAEIEMSNADPTPDAEAAKIVARALTSALKAVGADKPDEHRSVHPDTPAELRTPFHHIPQSDLSDYVVLACQGLKRII